MIDFLLGLFALLESAALWIPIAFAAFAIGRRRVGITFFLLLMFAESVGLAVSVGTFRGVQALASSESTGH